MAIPKLDEKIKWIKTYMESQPYLDVMNAKFVNDYIEEFNPRSVFYTTYAANKCKELGIILSIGYKMGIFKRHAQGLSHGNWQPSFPKWVYSYSKVG